MSVPRLVHTTNDFFNGLVANRSLTCLSMAWNQLGEGAGAALGELLRSNSGLKSLNLPTALGQSLVT